MIRTLDRVPGPDPRLRSAGARRRRSSSAPYRVYNIGNHQPVELLRYIEVLEDCLGRKAERNLLPLQPGDVPDTYADVEALQPRHRLFARPRRSKSACARFVAWYRDFYTV